MIGARDYLVPIELDPERDRDAWLAERSKGHGGSDVAKLLGLHPQEGPIDVWMAHTGSLPEHRPDTERSRSGRFLEPYVIQWFAAGGEEWPRSGDRMVAAKPPSVYHRDITWQRGSVDALIYDQDVVAHLEPGVDLVRSASAPSALLEVKTHGWLGSRGYMLDDEDNPVIAVPPDKRIQVAWYQALYGVEVGYLAAMVDTHLRRTFVILRDRELEAMLLEEVEKFRRRYILTGEPPPPDGSPGFTAYVRQRWKTHSAEIIDASPEVELAASTLVSIKREAARTRKARELAEQVIKNAIGENLGVRTSLGQVTWKSQESGKLRVAEALAELYRRLGMTDQEIAEFETTYAAPGFRVLRTPK